LFQETKITMAPNRSAHARAKKSAAMPSEAMLGLVRALARAAAIADYERQHPSETEAKNDNESGDLRSI
jgi:hypothetical protein